MTIEPMLALAREAIQPADQRRPQIGTEVAAKRQIGVDVGNKLELGIHTDVALRTTHTVGKYGRLGKGFRVRRPDGIPGSRPR